MASPTATTRNETVILHVGGMQFASEKHKVEAYLSRQHGVVRAAAGPHLEPVTQQDEHRQ